MDVSLRPLDQADLDTVRAWRNSIEVSRYMYTSDSIDAEQQKKWFERVQQDASKRYWIIEYVGRSVGVINVMGIDLQQLHCNLGIYFGVDDIRGKGLGRKALRLLMAKVFGEMGLHKLTAEAFSWNDRAIAMYERVGFQREAVLRDEVYKDGKSHDILRLRILKEEWET